VQGWVQSPGLPGSDREAGSVSRQRHSQADNLGLGSGPGSRDDEHRPMTLKLKPIDGQVLVITGASSGIGLVTATIATHLGAQVVLAARNARDLARAVHEIRRSGGRAVYQVADVSDSDQVAEIADTAIREFGRIDTWVNSAAVAM